MNDSERRYNEAIKAIGDLHGNMAVLSRLDALLKDYNSDLGEAERLIESDGALSGSIIQISNSVIYGVGETNDSVQEALQKVGFDQTLKLVSLALSKQVFMRDLDTYGVSADAYWRYSYFVAVFMEGQAPRIGGDASDAYLLGLLHGIGRVVINELLHVNDVEIFWDRFVPINQWELAMVGFTGEVAGSLLLKNWNFSESVYRRLANQSSKAAIGGDPMLLLLHYAKQLALQLDDPERFEALCDPSAHAYLRRHCRSRDRLRQEIAVAKENVATVHESLKES